jgi:hypothetical protein
VVVFFKAILCKKYNIVSGLGFNEYFYNNFTFITFNEVFYYLFSWIIKFKKSLHNLQYKKI